jgi:hypothetical protein
MAPIGEEILSGADGDHEAIGCSDGAAPHPNGLDALKPCEEGPGQPWRKPGGSNESVDLDTYDEEDPSEEGGEGDDKGEGSTGRSVPKVSKPRWAINNQAKFFLEQVYQMERFPSAAMRRRLAADFNVEPRQVQIWYQNRRQRDSRTLKVTQLMSTAGPAEKGGQGTSNAEVRPGLQSTLQPGLPLYALLP